MAKRSSSLLPFFKSKDGQTTDADRRARPGTPVKERVPNRVRNEFIAFMGEFGGTFMFLFMAFSATQVANAAAPATADNTLSQTPNTSVLLYISLAFGFSLATNAWAFFRISGGMFNPAVTLGMLLIGALTPLRAGLTFIAQMLAAMAAAGTVKGLFTGVLNVNTTLADGTSAKKGVFIEMFLTAELVFVIYMLAAEKQKATFLAPIGIGLALFVAEMCGVFYTGGSLNPARSFGPAVVTSFQPEHWIYWLGPFLGTLLAYGFYELMKYADYETANPGQDFNEHETKLFDPPADPQSAAEVARPVVSP